MNSGARTTVDDPFAAAMAQDERGRSLWLDAWQRLLKNRAAVISGVVMAVLKGFVARAFSKPAARASGTGGICRAL